MSNRWWVVACVGLLTACGTSNGPAGGAPPPPPPPPPPPLSTPPGDAGFNIVDNAFVDPAGRRNSQASITINAGEMAGWIHDGFNVHTVTFSSIPSGAVTSNSGTLSNAETFLQTLSTPGTYVFHCDFHPTIMTNVTIVVN